MGVEIERKFLVVEDGWRGCDEGVPYLQGYLLAEPGKSIRVRVNGEKATLTIKGAAEGITREEFEYPIPAEDARVILERYCLKPLIEKQRFCCTYGGKRWEIDEFAGENRGLIVAEVELEREDEEFELPPWAGREVSSDPRYLNASLARTPFSRWKNG